MEMAYDFHGVIWMNPGLVCTSDNKNHCDCVGGGAIHHITQTGLNE